MKAYDVVAYTYQAQTICPGCAVNEANHWLLKDGVKIGYMIAEQALDAWADIAKIDRDEEHTFDSDNFPKVVFASQIEDAEKCDECWEPLA